MSINQAFGIPVKELMMPNYEQVIAELKPKLLPLFDNIIPEDKLIKEGAVYMSRKTGSRTVYYDIKQELHQDVDISIIKNWVEEQATEFWKELKLNPELVPTVINSWCNICPPNSLVWPHNHIPITLTCVFYLDATPQKGNLILQNPMEAILAHLPYEQTYSSREFNYEIEAVTGKLAMFPGFIKHFTRPNESTEDRMSMSFNVIGVGGLNKMLGKTAVENGLGSDTKRTDELRRKFTPVYETGTPE